MKKTLFIAVLLLLGVTNLVHAGQYGPISLPGNDFAAFHVGGGYFYRQADLEGEGDFEDMEVQQHQVYAQGGLGLGRYWEAFIRVGGADLEVEDAFRIHRSTDFEGDFLLFGGGGLRGLLFDGRTLDIGAFVEGNYFSNYDDSAERNANLGASTEPVDEKIFFDDLWDVSAGLVLQTMIEGAYLYGGPMVYFSQVDVTSNARGKTSGLVDSENETLEEEKNLGAFVGVHWPLANGLNVSLEGQLKSSFSFGGALSKAF